MNKFQKIQRLARRAELGVAFLSFFLFIHFVPDPEAGATLKTWRQWLLIPLIGGGIIFLLEMFPYLWLENLPLWERFQAKRPLYGKF